MGKSGDITTSGQNLRLKAIAAAVLSNALLGRLIGIVFRNVIPHRGSRIRVLTGGDPRLNAYLLWGMYESAEIRYIDRFLIPGVDVVELGASIGGVSCEIAKRLGRTNKLVCVEANPDITGLLRENLDRNAPACDARIWSGAISYRGKSTVSFALGNSTLSSQLGENFETRTVPALTLAELLDKEGVGPYALVCDIEGAEVELFQGEREAFQSCEAIVIELHETRYQDQIYMIDDLIALILQTTGMRLSARYGEVCAFTRDRISKT